MKDIRKLISKKKVFKFLKNNDTVLCSLAIMMLVPAVGFCNDANNIQITPLAKPMQGIINFITGPLAGTVTVGSLVTGIASYTMGWEQSIMKKAGVGVCCGGAMTQVDTLCQSLGITASSCLF